MTLRRITTLVLVTFLATSLAEVAEAQVLPASVGARDTDLSGLRITPYDVDVFEQALEAQAWVVLDAARAHASANGGWYPTTVSEFTSRLPRGERMANLWTGEVTVPSVDPLEAPGSILYQPIVWEGHVVGAEVVAVGWRGERTTLVSDLGWWKRVQADQALAR